LATSSPAACGLADEIRHAREIFWRKYTTGFQGIPCHCPDVAIHKTRTMRRDSTVLVLYHYLYPDDVVSAVHFTELCKGLADRGWRVVGSACNRGCRDDSITYPAHSIWNKIEFHRVWRPRLRQASRYGRMVNAVWMIVAWSLMSLDPRLQPNIVIIGTDPVLSPIVALAWRLFRPKVRLVHWCFDLYPEAAIAGGVLEENAWFGRTLKRLLRRAYGHCNLIVDIGICMRQRLQAYGSSAGVETITPWALTEPEKPALVDSVERHALFGDARLGLLYSGTFGHAHSSVGIAELARALEPQGGRITFSIQGNAAEHLQESFQKSGIPIVFMPFAPNIRLETRLAAADVHIVTLRESWTGTVVPSKFFGALAVGRPVLFVGSSESAIAQWIEKFQVGWVLHLENFEAVVNKLVRLSLDQDAKLRLFAHCHKVYGEQFSQERAFNSWDQLLHGLISPPPVAEPMTEASQAAIAR
jgi:colanic acid biosynthesis glycosyl transferase WcaI